MRKKSKHELDLEKIFNLPISTFALQTPILCGDLEGVRRDVRGMCCAQLR